MKMVVEWKQKNKDFKQFVWDKDRILGFVRFEKEGTRNFDRWYWEVKQYMYNCIKDVKPPSGYAEDEKSAKKIVEYILKKTKILK